MWILLLVDATLLALHMGMTGFSIRDTAPESVDWARIDRDNSVSEIFEYLMLAGASALLFRGAVATRRFNMVPIAFLLVLLALDNMLRGHEYLSNVLLPGHQNYGEVLFFVLFFVVAVVLTMLAWHRANVQEQSYLIAIWTGILLLGGFGVGVDALHVKIWTWFIQAERWIGLVEDFGELVSISLITGICFLFARHTDLAPQSHGQKSRTGLVSR